MWSADTSAGDPLNININFNVFSPIFLTSGRRANNVITTNSRRLVTRLLGQYSQNTEV